MKKVAVLKKDIFLHVIKIMIGILEINHLNFGINLKLILHLGTHVRVHPLLDWTELDIWEYIERENIPVISLYFDQGNGKRYRSLGCAPCTNPVESTAKTVPEIVEELKTGKFANIAERSGREQDKEDGGGLETLRKDGYM